MVSEAFPDIIKVINNLLGTERKTAKSCPSIYFLTAFLSFGECIYLKLKEFLLPDLDQTYFNHGEDVEAKIETTSVVYK